jgi:hypothetical protein
MALRGWISPVGERQRLLVTGRAGGGLIAGQALVVEQEAAELDLLPGERVVGRDVRSGGRKAARLRQLVWRVGQRRRPHSEQQAEHGEKSDATQRGHHRRLCGPG